MSTPRHGDLLIPSLLVLCDALAIEAAFLLAYWLRFRTVFFAPFGFQEMGSPPFSGYLTGSLVVVVAWIVLFNARKMYGARRNVNISDELINVVKVVSLGMLIVMSAAFFYRDFSYSRVVFGLVWGFASSGIFLGRALVRALERRLYRHGRHLQQAIIVGNEDLAEQVYTRLHRHPSFGFQIVGYFADAPADTSRRLSQAAYLGTVAGTPGYIRSQGIDLAFIALRSSDHPRLFDLISECEGMNIEFMMVPDLLDVLTSQVRVRDLEGIPFLRLKGIPLTTWGRITKRVFDVAVSTIILVTLSPLLLLIEVAVRLDSRGPIIFRQKRVGIDGREFTMYKFRSMVVGSEQYDREAGLGIRDDPRRTQVGRFIRRFSLDELPQFWNVLRGDMSLVGPRPERAHVVRGFIGTVPKYLDRHRVKTGLTGWAQVNGHRGDTSIEERTKYDLYYIENWSLGFDIRILLRTVRAALFVTEPHLQ
jgi:exopolysaccharide biosynthesis polyprenyl glycosylphosphotransferase